MGRGWRGRQGGTAGGRTSPAVFSPFGRGTTRDDDDASPRGARARRGRRRGGWHRFRGGHALFERVEPVGDVRLHLRRERRGRGVSGFSTQGGGDQRIFRIRNDGTRRGARGGRARDAHHVDHVVHDIATARGVDPHVGPRRERGRHLARRCNATRGRCFRDASERICSRTRAVPSPRLVRYQTTDKKKLLRSASRSEPREACRRPSITERPSLTRARILFPLRLKLFDPARASGSARAVSSRGRRTADSY